MSVLTKEEILSRINAGDLSFSPCLDAFQVQIHSVDLRLSFDFMIPKLWEMSSQGRVAVNIDYFSGAEKQHFETIRLNPGQFFEILPREFVVVKALEEIVVPDDLMAILYPRSSVNRRGLSVDLSGIVDAGYKGNLIVPIKNNTSSQVIRIYPGERFCQLVFYKVNGKSEAHQSRFENNGKVVGVFKEKNDEEVRLIKEGKIEELKKIGANNL